LEKANLSTYFKPLLSHPDKQLEVHLLGVNEIVQENLQALPFEKIGFLQKEILKSIASIVALSHDLGKATQIFQDYLIDHKKNDDTPHALISSIQTYFLVYNKLSEFDLSDEKRILLSVIAFMAVKRHHGSLEEFMRTFMISPLDKDRLIRQTKSINEESFQEILAKLTCKGFPGPYPTSQILNWIQEFESHVMSIKLNIRKELEIKSIDYYLIQTLLFSLLIDADKLDVTLGKTPQRSSVTLSPYLVDRYKSLLYFKESKINLIREEAYEEITKKVFDLDQKIYSIHLPTGLGKTFASLSFALKLRNQIETKKGYKPRIIYSLPFMSIIDQNAEVFENVLKKNSISIDSSILLKHHHLAESTYDQDESNYLVDDARILIEGWNSELIVTTFVQVFETLISNRNRSLKKFHRMLGSIIILDEIQAIPIRYWELLHQLFNKLAQECNTYIIFVTATQPMIFKPSEIKALSDANHYFSQMDRIKMLSHLDESSLLEEFINNLQIDPEKSYLFIFNTIQSAKDAFILLQEKTGETILYLSTHVIPYERLIRIQCLKKKKVRFAVTTQLIEAGVDVDFDIVYRDLAPMDSINQSAGRCNRNWNKQGEIHIVDLKNENGKSFASFVYDSILLEQTRKVLAKNPEIKEHDFLMITEQYYKEIKDHISTDKSTDIIKAMENLRYDSNDTVTSIRDFHLIDQEPKLNIYIERNKEAVRIWKEYELIRDTDNKFERKNQFDRIKGRFGKYMISVYSNIKNIPPENEGIRYVNQSQLTEYYDQETGYKKDLDTPLIW